MRTVEHTPVRMGVVACGVVADYGHIPAIARSDLAELVAFAEPDEAKRKVQVDRYGKPGFASFAEMAAAVDLDAVSICTHPGMKLDIVEQAAAEGLHAFCEKPLTDTLDKAERLVSVMDAAGLFVGVAFIFRGQEAVQRIAQLLREGAIGRLRAIHIENMWDYHGLRGYGGDEKFPGARRRRALENLGALDCGVHKLDLARYLSGGADFQDIAAIGTSVEPENAYPDHIIAHACMTNGVLVSFEESGVWGYTAAERPFYRQSISVVGERGVICVESQFGRDGGARLRVVSGPDQWEETVGADKSWDATYDQFFRTILGMEIEHRFIADGHDALANMNAALRVIEACQLLSCRDGEAVLLTAER